MDTPRQAWAAARERLKAAGRPVFSLGHPTHTDRARIDLLETLGKLHRGEATATELNLAQHALADALVKNHLADGAYTALELAKAETALLDTPPDGKQPGLAI